MYKLFVFGIADILLTTEQERILTDCVLIVGAKRFAPLVTHLPGKFLEITPLDTSLKTIRQFLTRGKVAVLASGDPLFYGIGKKLLAEFPPELVGIYPALSSIQKACALFKIPWDDAGIISLHGRSTGHLPGLLLRNKKNLILTDSTNSPDQIAGRLLDYFSRIGETELPEKITMLVAEDIGMVSERVYRGTLLEGSGQRFAPLNILCLMLPGATDEYGFRFGLSEQAIKHSRGLITKNEVRAATLHQLQLPADGIFWDIGAGSGSISLEAARVNPELTVYSIEHKQEELANIKNNIVKFRCYNIVPVFGRAPESLLHLPAPDRVFIGGSSGALPEIVDLVARRLTEDGQLVINGVIDKTVQTAPELMRQYGFSVASSAIKVSRTEPGGETTDFNPITIMTGRR